MRPGWWLLTTCLLLFPIEGFSQTAQELFERATMNLTRGDLVAAEVGYKAAIATDPSYDDAYHNLGLVYAQQQRWPEAEAAYRKALELDSRSWQTLENLSALLARLNRFDEAVGMAQRLVSLGDSEHARLVLARVYVAAGKVGDGCREFQRALNFNSANAAMQLELSACHAENSDFDAAALHAGAVLVRDPKNPSALALLESIRARQRAYTWWWAPALVFLASLCGALGARRPAQWGQRRVAFGLMATSLATLVWLYEGSLFWLTGGVWGLYQFYAADRFRRTRANRLDTRAEYLRAAATILGCVALSDGELQPAELRMIRETYEKQGFSDDDVSIIGQTLRQCVSDFESKLFDHQALYAALRDACIEFGLVSNESSRLQLFRAAISVALADQHASPGELSTVKACGTWLNLSEVEQDEIWREVASKQALVL